MYTTNEALPLQESKDIKTIIQFKKLIMVKEHTEEYDLPEKITSPEAAAEAFEKIFQMSILPEIHFCLITLDIKLQIIGVHLISKGELSKSFVHPREVFKVALLDNAHSIIIGHNNPSGCISYSTEDVQTTERLVEAAKIIGIEVKDHIIIGDDGKYLSFREMSLI